MKQTTFIIIIIYIIINLFIIWDLYPLWIDYKFRYIQQKSYLTNTYLDIDFTNLDNIIKSTGDFEGHIACSKSKISYINNILDKYKIRNVCEIGFNAGHSATLFLNHKRNINNLQSFDLCNHKYSESCIKYIKLKYKSRFNIKCGDSKITIPKYKGPKFDLVFIDGGHFDNMPYIDIQNTIKFLSKPGTLILLDDTHYSYIIKLFTNHTVDKAWNKFIKKGIIKPISSIRGLTLGRI